MKLNKSILLLLTAFTIETFVGVLYANTYSSNVKSNYLYTLDYGARHYDPSLARWMTPDPMAEKYYPLTQYNYCGGNPVKFVDPDGKKVLSASPFSDSFETVS
jgi:RHS repeat-associated protein